MRDNKSLLLLLLSLLLVLVSFVLIWTWGYSFYTKTDERKTDHKLTVIDSAAIAGKISDSLQKIYAATLHDLDSQLDSTLTNSDSLKTELDIKLAEFYRLKTDIVRLLKDRNAGNDFAVARQKIGQLQIKADDLKEKNLVVDLENKKLADVLKQITKSENDQDRNIKSTATIKNNTSQKSNPVFATFTASDIRFTALNSTGVSEIETGFAEKADKLNGSFTVMNYNSQLINAEIMVIVLAPEGRVLKSSGWDSGTFNTPDGKKVYSYKFNFPYSMGEPKRLFFTLRTSHLTKGNYSMEVYHNGLIIGRLTKNLS